VRLNGPGATVHGNRNRKPVNATAGNVKDLVSHAKIMTRIISLDIDIFIQNQIESN